MKNELKIKTHLGKKIPKNVVDQSHVQIEYKNLKDALGLFQTGFMKGRAKAHLTHNGYFAYSEKDRYGVTTNWLLFLKAL